MSTLAVILLLAAPAAADFGAGDAGTAGANFLKLPVGARAAALGGAYSAVVEDPTALYWNPAGLAGVRRPAASTMFAAYLAQTRYQHLGLAAPLGRAGTVGLDAVHMSLGSITETDATGAALGTFRPYNLAVALGWGLPLGPLRLGGAARFISSRILATADTTAFDAGIQADLSERLRLAAAVQNLGPGLKFEAVSDPLPLTFRLGSRLDLTPRWLAAVDAAWARDGGPVLRVGSERVLHEGAGRWTGRIGYDTVTREVPGLSGLSLGFGAAWRGLEIDYAFGAAGELGLTHRVGVGFAWGRGDEEKAPRRPRRARARETRAPGPSPWLLPRTRAAAEEGKGESLGDY